MAKKQADDVDFDELKAQLERITAAQARDFVQPRHPPRILIERFGIPRSNLDNWAVRKIFELDADRNREDGKARLYSARDCIVLSTAHQVAALGAPLAVGRDLGTKIADYVMQGMGRIMAARPSRPSVMLYRENGDWEMKRYSPDELDGSERLPPVRIEIDVEGIVRDVLDATMPGAMMVAGNADGFARAAGKRKS